MTRTWHFERQSDGSFLMWLEQDPQRPLPASDLTKLEDQCRANSIFDQYFDDICRQLQRTDKATVTVPTPGKFGM
jgi:hypothetical protein